MARKPRIHIPGCFYHVILRGNDRQEIFHDQGDRRRFHHLVCEGLERFDHQLHAICMMTNHVHLAVQAWKHPLSRIVQNLAFRYARWMNFRHNRSGHLFQGRYEAIAVDSESHLLELVRYIHLNPVRAGLAATARDYPWSSHRAYLGEEEMPGLTTAFLLNRFSEDVQRARNLYREFIDEGVTEEHRDHGQNGFIDGRFHGDPDRDLRSVPAERGTGTSPAAALEELIRVAGNFYGFTESDLKAPGRQRTRAEARSAIAWIARETGICSLADVSRRFNRDISTLSKGVAGLEASARQDPALSQRLDSMRREILNKPISQA